MTRPIDLIDLGAQRRRLGSAVDDAIARVLEHGRFIMGPEVAELESQLADRAGTAHCISCASGTDALLMVLLAWGIGSGDAVFVPSFTFAATAEVVALCNATPVFVDVLPETFNLDPSSLDEALDAVRSAGALRPAAIVPVDLFGQPAEYAAIADIARHHGVPVLADAAQSFGARLGERPVGSLAEATTTSFFPAKPLGCYGDGGAIFTDDPDVAARLRSIRVHGQGAHKYENVRIGINGRLDTIQAAVLQQKLTIFDDEIERRDAVARRYGELLGEDIRSPMLPTDRTSAWAQYTIILRERDTVASRLKERGVPTAIYYPTPLHRQPAYESFLRAPNGLATSEDLAAHALSLPMHPYLEPDQQQAVVDALREES